MTFGRASSIKRVIVEAGNRFRRATQGSTAVEFGLISPFLLLTILFILSVGYILFMSLSLDYATQKAARQVRTGAVQSAGLTQTQFRTQIVCPALPSMFNCNNVIVNMQAVPYYPTIPGYGNSNYNQYYTYVNSSQSGLILPALDNSQTSYCPGNGQTKTTYYYVYLQILYPVNLFMSLLSSSATATTFNGQKVYLIMGTATFLNEPFTAPASPC